MHCKLLRTRRRNEDGNFTRNRENNAFANSGHASGGSDLGSFRLASRLFCVLQAAGRRYMSTEVAVRSQDAAAVGPLAVFYDMPKQNTLDTVFPG
jgi:hypothetical protein